MIICANCNHQNPDGATQCEACYTPLPMMIDCPNCGATVQSDAHFCGQCGFNLKTTATAALDNQGALPPTVTGEAALPSRSAPPLINEIKLAAQDPLPPASATIAPPSVVAGTPHSLNSEPTSPELSGEEEALQKPLPVNAQTQLQQQQASLLHIRSSTLIEFPQALTIIHIGKPNDRIPPDIDVSGFPDSEVVSRIHADIRVEGDNYFIEDVGSSNGTYVNNLPLSVGDRHRLRPGDRISLGKGDRVSFLFQIKS